MRRPPFMLCMLLLIVFIDSMGYFLLAPVLLRLIEQVHVGHWQALFASDSASSLAYSFAIALAPLASLIAAPFIGSLSDAWGRKRTLAACLSVSLLGFILPVTGLVWQSFSLILLGRILAGVASSSQPIAQAAIADISSAENRARNLALVAFAMTLAMLLGPLMGAYLSDPAINPHFSTSTPFVVASFLVLVNLLMLSLVWRQTIRKTTAAQMLRLSDSFAAFKHMFHHARLRWLMAVMFIYELAWSCYFQYIPLYLSRQYHYSVNHISIFSSYLSAWMCFGLISIYPFIVKRLALQPLLKRLLLIASLSLFAISLSLSLHLLQWFFGIALVLAVGMAYPTLLSAMAEAEPMHHGWVLGTAAAMLYAAWMSSALLMGYLANISAHLPFYFAFISMALALLATFSLPKPQKTLKPDIS